MTQGLATLTNPCAQNDATVLSGEPMIEDEGRARFMGRRLTEFETIGEKKLLLSSINTSDASLTKASRSSFK
ncbi:hypothetical protein Tco_0844224 [Tanacetum coccineum]